MATVDEVAQTLQESLARHGGQGGATQSDPNLESIRQTLAESRLRHTPLGDPNFSEGRFVKQGLFDNIGESQFGKGFKSGIDGTQLALYALAHQLGREWDMPDLEDWGTAGVEGNLKELSNNAPDVAAMTDIRSFEDFSKWAASTLGQSIPSLASVMTGAGISAAIGKKAVEKTIVKRIQEQATNDLIRQGLTKQQAKAAVTKQMHGEAFMNRLRQGLNRSDRLAIRQGTQRAAAAGAFGVSAPLQAGETAMNTDFNTAVVAGIFGGALEALPALNLMRKWFPDVDVRIAGEFTRDFAKATGTQFMLEGSTEGAQQIIQQAAQAFYDPTFDLLDPRNAADVLNAAAAGALVGAVTGGIGETGIALRDKRVQRDLRDIEIGFGRDDDVVIAPVDPRGPQDGGGEAAQIEGFVPADNTVFEEINDRINRAMKETLEPGLNTIKDQFTDGVRTLFRKIPGMRTELKEYAGPAREAHQEFIAGHEAVIQDARRYAEESIRWITEQASHISDNQQRRAFVEEQMTEVQQEFDSLNEELTGRAFTVLEGAQRKIDEMGVFDTDDDQTLGVDHPETEFVFGKNKSFVDENDVTRTYRTKGDEAEPFESERSAFEAVQSLLKRFPNAAESAFEVRKVDGGWIVAIDDSGQRDTMITDEQVADSFDNAIWSARGNPDRQGRQAQIQQKGVKGKTFVDIPTMVYASRRVAGQNASIDEAMLDLLGHYLDRGLIDQDGFSAIYTKFRKRYPDKWRNRKIREEFEENNRLIRRREAVEEGGQQQLPITPDNLRTTRDPKDEEAQLNAVEEDFGTQQAILDFEPEARMQIPRVTDPESGREISQTGQNEIGTELDIITGEREQVRESRFVDTDPSQELQTKEERGRQTEAEQAREQSSASQARSLKPGESRKDVSEAQRERLKAESIADAKRKKAQEAANKRGKTLREKRALEKKKKEAEAKKKKASKKKVTKKATSKKKVTSEEKLSSADEEALRQFEGTDRETVADREEVLSQPTTEKKTTKKTSKKAAAKPKKPSAKSDRMTSKARVVTSFKGTKLPPRLRSSLKDLVSEAVRLMGKDSNVRIRVINRAAAESMVADDHPHASIAAELLTHKQYAVSYGNDGEPTYILMDDFENAGQSMAALIHELGHVFHYETWAQQDQETRDALWQAFVDDVDKRGRKTGRRVNRGEAKDQPPAQITHREFREWMADQFVDWMANRREPKTAMEKFMEKVAQKWDKFWEFIQANPGRFNRLNETYAEFADSVAGLIAEPDPKLEGNFKNEDAPNRSSKPLENTTRDRSKDDDPPPGLTREQWKQVKKRLDNYPGLATNADKLATWLNTAYTMALAPSYSVINGISKTIPAARELNKIFHRTDHGAAKSRTNYHQATQRERGRWMRRWKHISEGMSDTSKAALAKRLRELDGKKTNKMNLRDRQVRKLFDEMHQYLIDSGLPVGKIDNYFPRMFDRQKLIDGRAEVIQHLVELDKKRNPHKSNVKRRQEAEAFYNSLISDEAAAAAAQAELQKDELSMQTPAFANMRSRTVKDKFFDDYLNDDIDSIMANYISQAVKRAEYNRLLGEDFRVKKLQAEAEGKVLTRKDWDAQGKLKKIMDAAKKQGATDKELKIMKDFVDANLGMYGRDAVPDNVRKAMAGVVAYTNLRVLLFTVFASLPDVAGPILRSGEVVQPFKDLIAAAKDAATTESDLHEMAEVWGIVSDTFNQHVLAEYVDNHYMPPTLRKWNDNFFKWTGLNWWTNYTRKSALAVGIHTLQREAAKTADQTLTQKQRDRAEQFLAEFGLTADQVNAWVERGKPVYGSASYDLDNPADKVIAEALVQFVDESIMRPNAAQRPIFASHPAAMLLYHLKGYIYALNDIVLSRMVYNFRRARGVPENAAALAPAVLMLFMTAVGMELRELVTGNRRTDRMSGWEYTSTIAERSGLYGLAQLGFDFTGAGARGQSELAALGTPAISQLGDLISRPVSQTIPQAIPVVSQLPWARQALRDATPL